MTILLLISMVVFANSSEKCDQVIDKKFYKVCYSHKNKGALFISYSLYGELVDKINIKKRPSFYSEKNIPLKYRSKSSDYVKSGFDRGHLLSDASAERSAAACTVKLNKEPIIEYLKSNIVLIEEMIKQGYQDAQTLQRRADKMKAWIENPVLLQRDEDAEYAAVIEIDMNEITEPILACPNDPDDVKTLTEIHEQGLETRIDEVFVGSCMTNIGLFRALGEVLRGEGQVPTRLWICPPTKMDERQLRDEGYYSVYGMAGARTEIPGCSLCMGNQARVADNAMVFSTSTRNFDNRLGKGAKVYLGSAELAAVAALKGKLPTKDEYLSIVPNKIKPDMTSKVYKYLNFNEVEDETLDAMVK
jgi:aconitate hydratase 2/2-methylisocitrate dehydratase